ncbi:MAG: hypothetical protein ACRCZY_03765 [Phocaeicola sp.]
MSKKKASFFTLFVYQWFMVKFLVFFLHLSFTSILLKAGGFKGGILLLAASFFFAFWRLVALSLSLEEEEEEEEEESLSLSGASSFRRFLVAL